MTAFIFNKFAFSLWIMMSSTSESHVLEEDFMTSPENYQELINMRSYSRYRSLGWGRHGESSVELINLPEKISTLPTCLNHIINFNGINLPGFQTPIVLSRYDVVHVKYRVLRRLYKFDNAPTYTNWKRSFPYETVSRIIQNETAPINRCQRKSEIQDLECFDIPFVDNSVKSRGWNCESHWYLYPPNPLEDPLFYELSAWNTFPLRMVIPASYKKFWSHQFRSLVKSEVITPWILLTKSRRVYDVIITNLRPNDFQTMKAWTTSLHIPYNGWFYQYTTLHREELTFNLVSQMEMNSNRLQYKLDSFADILNSNTDNIHWGVGVIGEHEEAYYYLTNKELLQTSPYDVLRSESANHDRKLWTTLKAR
ncbi:unnamed protein product [Orchesella dallaii]|uniref:Uncharacterized protein n=1 Tax=Orchesella dallaii TaxID=48710 RepID=A0ABP1RN14_9HEXA